MSKQNLDSAMASDATPAIRPGHPPTLTLVVNGCVLGAYVMDAGPRRYARPVLAAAWRIGVNDVVLRVNPVIVPAEHALGTDRRTLGAAVTAITFERTTPGAAATPPSR